jgi:hypothetical protein
MVALTADTQVSPGSEPIGIKIILKKGFEDPKNVKSTDAR